MKLLYIALCNLNESGQAGINKKISNQLQCFKKEYDTYFITQTNWIYCIYHNNKIIEKKALLTFEDIYDNLFIFIQECKINCVYIRYLRANLWLIEFLKKLKKVGIKVILEFPTIPYDAEIAGTIDLEEDLLYRNKLKKHVNMSVNFNGLNNVFGIPSIPLHNGINIDNIPCKENISSNNINLIAVATMDYWHGYDRIIKGMAKYYNEGNVSKKVYFSLVGDGKEITSYVNLIKQFHLDEYVILKGEKYGDELDQEFDNADIAIGVLGQYRKNADQASPIKTKEYCARGIPIILGHKDLAFNDKLPFILSVPNNDSDVNINTIIQFYYQCKEKCSSKEIRGYAERFLTWDNILRPVKEYFNN